MKNQLAALLAVPVVLCAGAGSAHAAYPDRPVTIVVSLAPGGVNDLVARRVAQSLSEHWKQSVVVENRAGGSGLIAGRYVAKAAPDGYKLLMVPAPFAAQPALFPNPDFDIRKDLVAAAMLCEYPLVIMANLKLPMTNLEQMRAYLRAQGSNPVHFSTSGQGSTPHIAAEMLKHQAKNMDNFVHVPYKGASEAMISFQSGIVPFTVVASTTAIPMLKNGKAKAIAVTSAKRDAQMPDVPTIAESGIPGFELSSWSGLMAPVGTPAPVIKEISDAVLAVLADPELQKSLEQTLGVTPKPMGAQETAAYITSEIAKATELVKAAHMQVNQ